MKKFLILILVFLVFLTLALPPCTNNSSNNDLSNDDNQYDMSNLIDYSQYLKKIWVVSNWDGVDYTMFCSFRINKIENNKIEGSLSTGEVALPDFFAYSFTPSLYSNNLTGNIINGIAECQFNDGEGTEGTIILIFHENDIEATYNYTNIPDYILEFSGFSVNGTYLFKPYNIKNACDSESINHFYPTNLDYWGDINVITSYSEKAIHPCPIVFLADDYNNILYEIFTLPNGHPISNIFITDLNGDGLKDIQIIICIDTDTEYEYDIIRIYYQMDNGLFYEKTFGLE